MNAKLVCLASFCSIAVSSNIATAYGCKSAYKAQFQETRIQVSQDLPRSTIKPRLNELFPERANEPRLNSSSNRAFEITQHEIIVGIHAPTEARKAAPECIEMTPETRSSNDILETSPVFLFGHSSLVSLTMATQEKSGTQEKNTVQKSEERQDDDIENDSKPLDGRDGRELLLRHFRPQQELKVAETNLNHAKFPVIDVHTHFRYRLRHSKEELDAFVQVMDRNRIAVCVSLDGRLGDDLEDHKKYLLSDYPDRFLIFANIDWMGTGDPEEPATWACQKQDFVRNTVEQLKQAKEAGVCGLKIFKQFGLGYRDADGKLLRIDDERWDPIWQACGELGLPIIIHTADPVAFFRPIDETNERWEELSRHPDWSFYGSDFPTRKELLNARNRVIKRHPKTTFIGAHVANNSEDLSQVEAWLKEYPNLVIGFASRIGELGRQPYTARRFFIDYQDRILFSTDGPWPETRLRLYWRFLETYDEYFPYSEKELPPQGFWQIYGIGLPDEVLEKVYFGNACRIIPGAKEFYQQAKKDLANRQ